MKCSNDSLESFINGLQQHGRYCFIRDEAVAYLGKSSGKSGFIQAAIRLQKKGRLAHVRRGFYIIIPLEYQAIGSIPASWFIEDFMQYLNQPYYVALLSAAAIHDAAHQQPMVFQVITNKQTRPVIISNLKIEFYHKQSFSTEVWAYHKVPTGRFSVSTTEMTAYDIVQYHSVSGYLNNVATILLELAENIDAEKLAEMIEQNHVGLTNAQRLGYLLESLNVGLDLQLMHQALSKGKTRFVVLDVKSQHDVFDRNERWKILINEHVEPDVL
ncbi:MAG: type IV toxin-antitoxin system AbiEi family antitoxin [Coxiellaceae bacterium]|nr:type IV toxin-antitoxin system AbiEi family antitoxin [Coxiellaceae bacterium]